MSDDYRRDKRDTGPRKNHFIKAQTVRLIDEDEGNIGVVPIHEAMRLAREAEKDLIEVSPNADPPVAKIMDYSKYLYEQRKKSKKGVVTGKTKDMKEFKFSPVIQDNDVAYKIKRAKLYLGKGHNVRITIERRGRQTAEQTESKFTEILTNFEGYSSIEPVPKREGRRISMTYKPDGKAEKPQNGAEKIKKVEPKGKAEGETSV